MNEIETETIQEIPISKKRKTTFSGDVLKLTTGTAIAQVIAVLSAPLLTRLYAPEAFGVLALFISITGILGVIACMRYELSIVLPECDREAANLLGVSLGFAAIISVLTVLIIWLGRDFLVRWLNAPGLSSYLWLVPAAVFIHGVFLALNYWNSRTKHFGRLSIARVTASLATTTAKLGAGYAGYATGGTMIGASVGGQAIATTVLGGQTWRNDRKLLLRSMRWQAMCTGMSRHKKFPLFSTWSALMNTVSVQLPLLLLATFFSSTVVGFYALGHRLLSMPMSLIGSAIAQAFFPRAAAAKIDGTLPQVIRNTVTRLMALGLFPILLISIAGKDIFFVVFGSRWAEAGVYAQILAPWILFVFLGSPISTRFSVLVKQGESLVFNAILLVTRIASLVAGGLTGSILLALMLYAGTGTIMWIGLCLYLLNKADLKYALLARDTFPIVVAAMISLLPILGLKVYSAQPLTVIIAGCLCTVLYYIIIYFRDKELQKLLMGFAGRFFRPV